MNEQTFSEAIKLKDGVFYNLPFHAARMAQTVRHFFGDVPLPALPITSLPDDKKRGLYKCRIVYNRQILSVEYIPYTFKTILTAKVVHDDTIDYAYKSTDRSRLHTLLHASGCDEIIILKNGFATDASASNLVFQDKTGLYTPDTCLLPGTKRASLLEKGIIRKRAIREADIRLYERIYLINAMIDLEDNMILPPL